MAITDVSSARSSLPRGTYLCYFHVTELVHGKPVATLRETSWNIAHY